MERHLKTLISLPKTHTFRHNILYSNTTDINSLSKNFVHNDIKI